MQVVVRRQSDFDTPTDAVMRGTQVFTTYTSYIVVALSPRSASFLFVCFSQSFTCNIEKLGMGLGTTPTYTYMYTYHIARNFGEVFNSLSTMF